MTNNEMLKAIKVDLGISTTVYDERLGQYLQSARAAITREGITLTDSVEDGDLIVRYAAWLWRKRATGDGIPRSLRWAMNNRLFSEKAGGPAYESDSGEES